MRSQDHAPESGAVTSGQLADLIARVEAANGGERFLDALLWDLEDPRPRESLGWDDELFKRDPQDSIAFDTAPPYSYSLDAALALVERVLPGTTLILRRSTPTYWMNGDVPAGQWGVILDDSPLGWTVAKTPALALLLALLRALQAQAPESNRKDGSSPKNTEAFQ